MEAMEDAKSSSSLTEHSSVTTIFKSSVYPDQPSTLGRLNLSVFDLRMLSLPYIQWGLLFAKPILSSSDDLINHLRSSLSRALSFYPPLAGRLSTYPDGSFFIACDDAGAEFVHAVAPGLSLADVAVRYSDVPEVVNELFLLHGAVGFDGSSSPLAAVQVTELADGVFVGCSINHAVVDGASFWNFICAWSELCRGVENISWPPDFNRDLLEDSPPVQRRLLVGRPFPTATSRTRVFRFSREAIQDLKARANSSAGAMEAGSEISSLQSLCAQVWRSVTKARNLSPGTEIFLRVVANCRNRMEPPLGTHYFGSAVLPIVMAEKAEEVVGKGLGWCARLLHRNVSAFGNEAVRKAVEKWKVDRIPATMGSSDGTVLFIASSPRFAVYENDMGWGRPVGVLSGSLVDGSVSAFPGREGGGSIDLEVCLAPETMARLESDGEFMQYIA